MQEVLGGRDQIAALEGIAGAGKTTSLSAVRDAAERDGYRVEGFAPTSRATYKLEEAGILSSTLQHHLAREGQTDTGEKHLYVIDESSLASTRQINEFLTRLGARDRVLLVGDVRQHEAVEAGTPLSPIAASRKRTAHLDEIVRQRDLALKEAVEQLARGDIHAAIDNLDRQGRVQQIENREERFQTMAREYARHPQGTLVVSPDNRSRHELNALIHHELQERGQVQPHEHTFRVLEARQELTGADRAWAEQYVPGDVLRYSRGSKAVGVNAGEYATVANTDAKQNLLTVEREDGQQCDIRPAPPARHLGLPGSGTRLRRRRPRAVRRYHRKSYMSPTASSERLCVSMNAVTFPYTRIREGWWSSNSKTTLISTTAMPSPATAAKARPPTESWSMRTLKRASTW